MNFLRDTYSTISFRGRLLLLLVGVSLVQALVAAYTFHTLQSKPVEQRVQAQLNAGIRSVAPVIDQELKASAKHLQQLASNPELQKALQKGDTQAATRLLDSTGTSTAAGDGTVAFSSDESTAGTATTQRAAYVVDAQGDVIAGRRPAAPLIDEEGVTSAPLRRGAELIGTLHVPVVVDEAFIASRIVPYVDEGVTVFVADDTYIATADGVSERPEALEEGLHTYEIDGARRYSLAQPVLQQGVLVGAGIDSDVIVAQKRESEKSLMGFIFALAMLMIVVSYAITRSVGDVLRRFAGITQQLATGDLARRIPVTGNDEIATLSTSFNDMAEKLEDRMERLIDARARMARQLELFGEALANATSQGEMLHAVCGLAMESTSATHARFWSIDEEGRFVQDACVGLRPNDVEPCGLERSVTVSGKPVMTGTAPYWMVVPAQTGDRIIGLLTLVSTGEPFDQSQCRIAERIGVQAAVAIENARMHEQLREQATRDGLTGLANHRSMQDSLRGMLAEAYEHRMPLGVALFDVDNFKKVNDTYGHQIGDEALKAIARVLNHCVAGAGLPARYGGEEFVVVMPGCDAGAACRIAERIREEIMEIRVPLDDGGELRVTSSFGVADTDQYAGDVEQALLLNHADMALYRAKRTGKNRVQLATPEVYGGGMMEMSAEEKAALEARDRGESAAAA